MFDNLLPLPRVSRHSDRFLCFLYCVSRHSVIFHSSRSTRADLFVYVCMWMFVLLMLRVLVLLLETVPYAFSARGGAASHTAARETGGCGSGRSHNKNRPFCPNISVSKYTPFWFNECCTSLWMQVTIWNNYRDWKCPQYFLLIKKSLHINVNRLLRIIIIIIYIHTR